MGLFDINIKRELQSTNKNALCDYLEKELGSLSQERVERTDNTLTLKKFKEEKSLLKFDLIINVDTSKKNPELLIEGELQNVWPLVILIALGILFTYGIGVVLLVGFVYYQKIIATRYLNGLIDEFEKKPS